MTNASDLLQDASSVSECHHQIKVMFFCGSVPTTSSSGGAAKNIARFFNSKYRDCAYKIAHFGIQ